MNSTLYLKFLPNLKVNCDSSNIPILNSAQIDCHVSEFLKYYESQSKYRLSIPQPTPIEHIIEYLGGTVIYVRFANENILGMNLFESGKVEIICEYGKKFEIYKKGDVLISSELEAPEKEGRLNFTLAHELGHIFYHEDYFNLCDKMSFFDFEVQVNVNLKSSKCYRNVVESIYNKTYVTNWVEWQADYFASCILMPKESVRVFMEHYFPHKKDFCFENKEYFPINGLEYYRQEEIIKSFMRTFNVSKQASEIRLNKLGYKNVVE